jgi:riboflavin transporter FmnP
MKNLIFAIILQVIAISIIPIATYLEVADSDLPSLAVLIVSAMAFHQVYKFCEKSKTL